MKHFTISAFLAATLLCGANGRILSPSPKELFATQAAGTDDHNPAEDPASKHAVMSDASSEENVDLQNNSDVEGANILSRKMADEQDTYTETTAEERGEEKSLLENEETASDASWIEKFSKEPAYEALLPLIAIAPVLAAAGFSAAIENRTKDTASVRFPSIDFTVEVEELKSL